MLTPGEDTLLRWAGRLSDAAAQVDRLGGALLGRVFPLAPRRPEDSALNNDGSPLQVCLTYTEQGRRWRLLGDPAAGVRPPETRLGLARQALRETLALTHAAGMEETCQTLLAFALPPEVPSAATDPGAFWLAGGLEGGAALYANMHWGAASDRWADVRRWLQASLPAPDAALALVHRLATMARLASIGVEGSQPANARLKLYWRLQGRATFAGMGAPPYWNAEAHELASAITGDSPMPLGGLVMSASFRLADGEAADVKLDFCAHCLRRSGTEWAALLRSGAMADGDLAHGIVEGQAEVAFVGIGVNDRGAVRTNVYLKAATQ